MNKITFDVDDKLERKPFAEKLTTAITTFYPFVEEAYVLSLNAEFGEGKTTFLRMWKTYLEEKDEEEKKHTVIYLNAWESDFDDEPLIPIASSLLEELKTPNGDEDIRKGISKALGLLAYSGNSILKHYTGIDAKEAESAFNIDTSNKLKGEKISESFLAKKEVYQELKKSLESYVSKLEKKPLFILVDELDRVRPDYAVKFLEAIKHIFSVQGICFVLAVNRKQLEASVCQLYGEIVFDNYYGRFVTREVDLPQISEIKDVSGFLEHVSNDYFDKKRSQGISFAFTDNQKPKILLYAEIVCRAFILTPRQIEYLFRIYSQFMAVSSQNSANCHTNFLIASLILIALFIKNKDIYHRIGKGELNPKALFNYLSKLNFSDSSNQKISDYESKDYIIMYSLASILTKDNEKKVAEMVMLQRNNIKNDSDASEFLKKLADIRADTFPSESSFQYFYKRLEEWRSFIE